MRPPAPPPARTLPRPPRKVPVWALHLLSLGMLALLGVHVAWTAEHRHGWDPWSAALLGAGATLLVGIAMGVLLLLAQQQIQIKLQLGQLEIAAKEVEVLQRLAGGRAEDPKGWAKRHRLDRQLHRRRLRGPVEP